METMLQDINYCMRPETEPGAGKLVRLINPTDNLRYHRHWELYLPRPGKNVSELRGKRKNSRLQRTSETGTSFRLRNSIWRIFFPITCVRYAERNYNILLSSPLPTLELVTRLTFTAMSVLNFIISDVLSCSASTRVSSSSSHFTVLITPNLV